jgi:hypothetical protein
MSQQTDDAKTADSWSSESSDEEGFYLVNNNERTNNLGDHVNENVSTIAVRCDGTALK